MMKAEKQKNINCFFSLHFMLKYIKKKKKHHMNKVKRDFKSSKQMSV